MASLLAHGRTLSGGIDGDARRTARWVATLFLLEILIQRFQVPGQPVALLLPVLLGWTVLALRAGVLQLDRRRLLLWWVIVSISGVGMLLQTAFLPAPAISINSWMLFIVVWLPAVCRFADRRLTTYLLAIRRVVAICTGLAGACIAMLAIQLAGVGYQDYLARLVPSGLLLNGFVITYPIQFGSSIYRANAWIGLEPSIVSFLIGLGLLAAVLTSASWWQSLVMALGLVSTFAGSGFMVVIVGALAALAFPARRLLLPYVLPAAALVVVVLLLPLTQPLVARTSSEFVDENSSASLRAVEPYIELWPHWSGDLTGVLLGRGAGAAQRFADNLGIANLLVPTLARVLFDYGLAVGGVIVAIMLFFYLEGPSAAIAFTSFVSLWALQPGGSQVVFALPVMALVTFFAPRDGARIEEHVVIRERLGRRSSVRCRDATLRAG